MLIQLINHFIVEAALKHSNSATAKLPILLPRHRHISKCLVAEIHCNILHRGTADTLVQLRENYWLPKDCQVVNQSINQFYFVQYCTYTFKICKNTHYLILKIISGTRPSVYKYIIYSVHIQILLLYHSCIQIIYM